MPKISIIVPIYNSEKYLNECLESLINQTFKDIEIICVNDGSTDKSLGIVQEFAKKDNRIIVINQENKGQSAARNAGLKIASGEWLTFIDSDDYVDTNAYEFVLNYVQQNDLICFGIQMFGDNHFRQRNSDEEYYKIKFQNKQKINDKIIFTTDVSVCNKIFKKDIIDKYDINFTENCYYEDAEFYLKYISCCNSVYFIDKYFYHYRRTGNSIMSETFSGTDRAIDHLYIIKYVFDFWLKYNFIQNHISLFEKLFFAYFNLAYNNSTLKMRDKILYIASKYANEFAEKVRMRTNFVKYLRKKRYNEIYEPDLKFYQKIFGIRKVYMLESKCCRKNLYILGIRFKLRDKNQEIYSQLNCIKEQIENNDKFIKEEIAFINQEMNDIKKCHCEVNNLFFDLFLDQISLKRNTKHFVFLDCLREISVSPEYLCVDSSHNYLNLLLQVPEFHYKKEEFNSDKMIISWELSRWNQNLDTIKHAIRLNKKILFIGDSFLRSINTFADKNADKKLKKGISFCIDDLSYYYDATRKTRLEQMLNDKNLIITDDQKNRAQICIHKIIENHLTKYNHQPIFEPKIGREGVRKVLVVDQSYGDMSIKKGLADENTFKEMLDCAIKENPEADIIVKTHPDTMVGAGGYYTGLKQHDNIYPMTEPINPISLIKYVDKVYVCTTQFGFEALMCGKEVHVFGMPFYAGWGLTNDRQKCERRTNKRTLEEIFYIAYIMYSYYVSPERQCRCEIEEAMDYLLKLRDEYFANNNK